MTPDTVFPLANMAALAGWVALLASPWQPRMAQIVSGTVIPLGLALLYTAIVLAFWSSGEGGFDTLANVAALFKSPWLLLAGWVHYLAFDLFVGAWIARRARDERIPFLLVIPCLALTFLFGPAGFLAFSILRASFAAARPKTV